ncbi:MAG: hypothetical protein ACTHJS_07325 [Xanthobacteraceae bacterium]
MREYDEYTDDSIRLYTPVFQRVIILAAVIIAVPVLMWTITTFVRSYVARPRLPTLEHVASTTPSTRLPLTATPPSPAPADQAAAPRIDGGSVGDAVNPAAETKQGAGSLASPPGSSAPGVTNSPSLVLQTAPRQGPSPGSAASAAATGDASPAPLVRQPQAPQGLRLNDGAAQSAGPSSPDRGIAWPNPNATNAPDFGAPRLASPAAPPAPTAAAEVVPAGEPLSGPVPLPRHRPGILAMAGTTTASITGSIATGGPVPLPRARPGDAPAEAASPVIEQSYGYRPGLDADR